MGAAVGAGGTVRVVRAPCAAGAPRGGLGNLGRVGVTGLGGLPGEAGAQRGRQGCGVTRGPWWLWRVLGRWGEGSQSAPRAVPSLP